MFHAIGARQKTKSLMCIPYAFCLFYLKIEQKDYRLFSGWLSITTALELKDVPHWTTLQKAFKRLPPRLIRRLMQLAGKCKDHIAALDPTYYQLSNPSSGYIVGVLAVILQRIGLGRLL